MRIDVVSIFPDYFAPLELSLLGRARADGLVDLRTHDLRDWTHDRHRTVDDTPYGGGAGMVMTPQPWGEALDELARRRVGASRCSCSRARPARRSPSEPRSGSPSEPHLVFAAGRYEGIDQRVVDHYADAEPRSRRSRVGDYVLNGGEVAIMVMIEAITRLLPGFMGNPESLAEESHHTGVDGGLLEYPVYTKPPSWRGHDVPEVLFSGHHAQIARWRRDQSLRRTAERRPDLLEVGRARPGRPRPGRARWTGRSRRRRSPRRLRPLDFSPGAVPVANLVAGVTRVVPRHSTGHGLRFCHRGIRTSDVDGHPS